MARSVTFICVEKQVKSPYRQVERTYQHQRLQVGVCLLGHPHSSPLVQTNLLFCRNQTAEVYVNDSFHTSHSERERIFPSIILFAFAVCTVVCAFALQEIWKCYGAMPIRRNHVCICHCFSLIFFKRQISFYHV